MDKTVKKTIELSAEVKNNKLILDNGIGNRWNFPANISRSVALASLVYSALLYKDDEVSCYSSWYRISLKVEILDDDPR